MKQRIAFFLLLGALLALATVGHWYLWNYRPVGRGPAGPIVPREPFRRAWSPRKTLLLGVGDSITAGFRARPGHGYFDLLAANPPDEFDGLRGICLKAVFPQLRTLNLAVSGSTSLEHLEILKRKLAPQDADVLGIVVMTTGGNDLLQSYGRQPPREGAMFGATLEQAQPWIKNFQKRLDAMVDLLESRFPGGCHVFLADIYDPTDGLADVSHAGLPSWNDGYHLHRAYNDVIDRCARRRSKVHLVPIYREFLGHGIHCTQFWRSNYCLADPHDWFYDNLEDPNSRGHDAIRRVFLLEISRTFQAIKSP
jgi:lysophospholipase L1-like esterase